MRLGAYDVLREVGRGGLGVVFEGRAPDGRSVAIKVLARTSGEALRRFARERRLQEGLGLAEGFVPLLDAGESPEGPFLVMPFVEGGTLRARLRGTPWAPGDVVEIGRTLARALGAAHARGIVHRDVKPENVLYTRDGKPLLADLGLAKHFDRGAAGGSQSVSLSRAGGFRGTAGYVAPEQIEDARRVGPACDVYSLGAVLYECLTGRPVHEGDSVVELLKRIAGGTFEPVRHVRPDTPPWLAAVIERALAAEPARRFADGVALARALEAPVAATRSWRLAAAAALVLAVGGAATLVRGSSPSMVKPRPLPARPPVVERPAADGPASREAIELSERALALARKQDLRGAVDLLGRAIELDPKLASAWERRGAMRIDLGDLEGGLSDIEKAIEVDPRFAAAWHARGIARRKKGDLAGAISDFSRVLELDPNSLNSLRERAHARDQAGDLDGELSDVTRALELDGSVAALWQERADVRCLEHDLEGAIADATRALEIDPACGKAYYTRGAARGLKRDVRGEIADERKAVELLPGFPKAWEDLGAALCSFNESLDEGLADLTHAIEMDPTLVPAFFDRAGALTIKGDIAGARADYERVLQLIPADHPRAAEVRRWLAEHR